MAYCIKLSIQRSLQTLLLFFLSTRLEARAYPHPYPYPYPNPYAHASPAVPSQPAIAQRSQYVQIFDKTHFKPPELEDTIEEVQRILQKDPSLPRLTRGEIEELYEKVTREEYQKSISAGDVGRAASMRALMLVLPYNTDNSTSDRLQELYTRPPVTKVIDGYTQHPPIKFITPNSSPNTQHYSSGQLAATTYKPGLPFNVGVNPTTYHPPPPAPVLSQRTPSVPEPQYDFQPITNQPAKAVKPVQRFSSHYNAKDADFLRLNAQKQRKVSQTSSVRPVADVLESLGIVGQTQSRKRFTIDDYYPAESAPKPVISSYIPLNGDFERLRGPNIAPKITPEAYTSFKPLNIGEEVRVKPEVEDYLTRFGIVGGRKRKALKKGQNAKSEIFEEQTSAGTELSPASVPNSSSRSNNNVELEKLLQNLRELERLNGNKKKGLPPTPSSTTSTSTTTTTKMTTESPTVSTSIPSLITNGAPMLIEAKKPRRRIDPQIDLSFGASGNQQLISTNDDQLAKLLDNLQELEKLRLNPENVLKNSAPSIKAAVKPVSTTTTTTSTTPPPAIVISSGAQNEQLELQRLLRQLQSIEQSNVRATTTRKPSNVRQNAGNQFDLLQLRKLLADDSQLERLYEQARSRIAPSAAKTTATSTTTTTKKPSRNEFEFEQLQKYLAELDRARTSTPSTTTSTTSTTPTPTTTTTTTSTTTTTTTTPRPTTSRPTTTTTTTVQPPKKVIPDDAKIQELINRVQQLERLHIEKPKTTTESMPYLGFTSRNVNAPASAPKGTANDYRVTSNDFAQLQQLYRQVQEADRASFGQVEISTAATASKYTHKGKQTEEYAQRIIDITNDTGSESSLKEIDSNDYVQLQKLLSKVKELERVRINVNGVVERPTENPRPKQATFAPSLVTASSLHAPSLERPNAYIVYPEKSDKYLEFVGDTDDRKLDLSGYVTTTRPRLPSVRKKSGALLPEISSSEELRELAYSKPGNPKQSSLDSDFERYQEFFTSLEDGGERQKYRTAYENMEPPIIRKTVTPEPPKSIPDAKSKFNTLSRQQQADLNELQKLLSNAKELEKLGITVPKTLSDQIELKLAKTNETPATSRPTKITPTEPEYNVYRDRYGLKQKGSGSRKKIAVLSLTTETSLAPKSERSTTESPSEVPVFSATKIIEDAIKQAANRIGVTTVLPQGFRRRSDSDVDELDLVDSDDGMVGEYSELNYQIAIPEINHMSEIGNERRTPRSVEVVKPADVTEDLGELQRLIGNLEELQKLNISISSDMLKLADAKYFESLKPQLTTADETNKSRRQSVTPALTTTNDGSSESKSTTSTTTESSSTTASISSTTETPTTSTAPTRVELGTGLDDKSTASSSTSTTTEEPSTTEEPRNGSLADLEASFGPDPNKEEPLPAKKKNGFYFLADWNSFLEVGEGDDQVVVRFSPKIGDPRLFLPVKIP